MSASATVFGFATAFVPAGDATTNLPQTQSKGITRRTVSGACYRVETAQSTPPQECPESSKWMAKWLIESKFKAYSLDTNLQDPKQRKQSNHISNWCPGDDVKLWDQQLRRPVSSYSVQHAYASK